MRVNGEADGGQRIELGGGLDTVLLADRQETWRRAWAEKPAGAEISVRLPWILVSDPELQARLDALLVPETLLGQSRAEVEADGWVDRVDFEVGHQASGLICLRVRVEGSGAYPSTRLRGLIVHVPEARILGPEQLAEPEALAAQIDEVLQARAREADLDDPVLVGITENRRFGAEQLRGYCMTKDGLVFHHDWGFPHRLKAHAPEADVHMPWAALELVEGSPLRP